MNRTTEKVVGRNVGTQQTDRVATMDILRKRLSAGLSGLEGRAVADFVAKMKPEDREKFEAEFGDLMDSDTPRCRRPL